MVHSSVGKLKMRATQQLLWMCVGIFALRLFWLVKQETVNILKVKKMHMDRAWYFEECLDLNLWLNKKETAFEKRVKDH